MNDLPPSWVSWALAEVGVKETPGPTSTPRIVAYRELAGVSGFHDDDDGLVPWCAIFVNAALRACGFKGSGSAMAQSFLGSADFYKLTGPAHGALAVWRRGKPGSGLGHVAFYLGEGRPPPLFLKQVEVVGGNQGDAVSIARFRESRGDSWFLKGFWWPRDAPPPNMARRPLGSYPAAIGEQVT